MMDFLPNCPDLHNYIERNKKTLSVLSKLVLLSNIANGLRFLKNHHIVHMDLTLKNIMVGPNLVTKIIDFGESYCHMVKSNNYNPGFTNPYGPP
jgi:serine/threonine protein kinase